MTSHTYLHVQANESVRRCLRFRHQRSTWCSITFANFTWEDTYIKLAICYLWTKIIFLVKCFEICSASVCIIIFCNIYRWQSFIRTNIRQLLVSVCSEIFPNISTDPVVMMSFLNYCRRTDVINHTLNPVWDQTLMLDINFYGDLNFLQKFCPHVFLEVFDKDEFVSTAGLWFFFRIFTWLCECDVAVRHMPRARNREVYFKNAVARK